MTLQWKFTITSSSWRIYQLNRHLSPNQILNILVTRVEAVGANRASRANKGVDMDVQEYSVDGRRFSFSFSVMCLSLLWRHSLLYVHR